MVKAIGIWAPQTLLWELLCIQALGFPPNDTRLPVYLSHLCSPMLALWDWAGRERVLVRLSSPAFLWTVRWPDVGLNPNSST